MTTSSQVVSTEVAPVPVSQPVKRRRLGAYLHTLGFYLTLGLGLMASLFGAADTIFNLVGHPSFSARIPSLLLFAVGLEIVVAVIDRKTEREENEQRADLEKRLSEQTLAHEREMHRQETQQYASLQESLTRLGPAFSTLVGAMDNGVRGIFKKRKEDSEAHEAIRAHLSDESTQTISIAAIALPQFLHAREEFGEELKLSFGRGDVSWKILLLDPRSPAALERADRERTDSTIGDIQLSIRQIQGEIDEGTDVEARLYFCPPALFLLITENSMLVEPYHFGRIMEPTPGQPTLKRPVKGCSGGLVPLLQIRNLHADDRAYAIFRDHFLYLWEERSIPVYSGIRIARCDPNERAIVLTNSHRFTPVRLDGWSLTAVVNTRDADPNQGGGEQVIYRFVEADVLRAGEKIEMRDTFGADSRLLRYLRRDSDLSAFMDRFWADEHREVRLTSARGRVVAKWPNDGYVTPDDPVVASWDIAYATPRRARPEREKALPRSPETG